MGDQDSILTVSAHWNDDACPKSQRDGGHCNHVETHDVCCWCGLQWGEAGVALVPLADYAGAVDDVREALRLGEWEGVEMTREDTEKWAALKAKYAAPSDFGGGQ